MCNGRFALCIKAPCEKTPDANGEVRCSCIIQDGWSMGPNTCEDRAVHLTSTYSNAFNGGSNTITCPNASTTWAWCYGAKCVKDERDPKAGIAICKCPVVTSAAVVLVSNDQCGKGSAICNDLWSAAYPAESVFANTYYYTWMTNHGFQSPPPAEPCEAR